MKLRKDPSLDKSWRELFKIKKGYGPKNHPGCNFAPKLSPRVGRSAKNIFQTWDEIC